MTESTFGGAQTDDLLGYDIAPEVTMLDSLEAALSKKVAKEPVVLTVKGRPGITMRFDPTIEFELFQKWTTNAAKGRKDGSLDYMKMALVVISHSNTAVLINGNTVEDKEGNPLTIRSPRVHEMLKVPVGGVAHAIRAMYESDGHAIQAMRIIIEKAGYAVDADIEEEESDPLDL